MEAARTQSNLRHLPRRRRVTIAQLADELGLTKGTVSRALNGYPDISETTRARVKAKAARMGYQPLSHAQAIRTGRTRSLGLVLQVNVYDAQRPFLADFIAGVTQAASAEGWTLTISTETSRKDMLQGMQRMIDEHKADGFILPRTKVDDERVSLLKSQDVPFVLYGRTGDLNGCAWYDILGEDAMEEAVMRLSGFGHKRIGFVNARMEYNFAGLREEGFRSGLARAGITLDEDLIRENISTPEDGRLAVLDLMRSKLPPTAIVFTTDMAALGAYAACRELGLSVGRDLSIIAYDGIPEGAYANPPLTTFNVDTRRAGSRLADLLIRSIRGEPSDALRESDNASLLERSSDGPPALRSSELARRIKSTIEMTLIRD